MTKPRQYVYERTEEAKATALAVWSFAERLEAARALGLESWMSSPQEEMELNQGGRDGNA